MDKSNCRKFKCPFNACGECLRPWDKCISKQKPKKRNNKK